jgi:ABC-type amino acid transport substrate-binding protein
MQEGGAMRRTFALMSLLLAGAVAWACGDKLMLVMGTNAGQIKPLHPAAILVFPGKSASASLMRALPSQPAFKKAGHRLQLIEDPAGLDNALKAGNYDLVVADVANASELSPQVSAAPSKPLLLPLVFKASKEEQSAAQRKYHCLLKAPGNADNYLAAIDQAMDLKLKGAAR